MTLKQVEEFKYLGVAFTSDGRQDEELDTPIGKASAVMRALYYSVVMKRELPIKAKLSISKTVFVRILTYGHESGVMTRASFCCTKKLKKLYLLLTKVAKSCIYAQTF